MNLLHEKTLSSKNYHHLLMMDFRKRFYPFSMLVSSVFFILFLFNMSGYGDKSFLVLDLVAVCLFFVSGVMVKLGKIHPWLASLLGLCLVMGFYLMDLIYVGSAHGIIFVYCVIPFFAFYLGGMFIGYIQAVVMLLVLLCVWLLEQQGVWILNYSNAELFLFGVLLIFSIISAWLFEKSREKTFYDSYQKGEQHEALIDAIGEVRYHIAMDGQILEMSDALYNITGYKPSEVIKNPTINFYAYPEERQKYVEEMAANGCIENYAVTLVGKAGNHVRILMSSRYIFDEKGEPKYIEGMFRDITKEQKIEQERKEHFEHLEKLSLVEEVLAKADVEQAIKQSIDTLLSIFSTDRAFLVPLSFLAEEGVYNDLFIAQIEYNKDLDWVHFLEEQEVQSYLSMLSHHVEILSDIIDNESIFSARLMQKYGIHSHMMVVLQINTDQYWLLGIHNLKKSKAHTHPKRLFVDISRRIGASLSQLVLQKDLQATVERVEVASKAKSEFLATMSHELRTPLHGVIGLLGLLGEENKYLPKEQQRNLALAQTSSQVLSSLIDDVLDLAKIESGKIDLQKQSFYLQDALYDALVPFVVKAREKGLALNLEMKNVAEMIEGDAVRLRQVLLNLVGNAIKFTLKGYVRIVVTQDEQMLQINIEDSGIGIDRENQGVVFTPFTQVHDVSILGDNLQEKGTGLGTTISQHYVEMMGGTLTLQSEPEVGSTLSIRLPLQQVGDNTVSARLNIDDFSGISPKLQSKNKTKTEMLQPWSVLLAEDDPIGRRIALKRLESAGFNVIAVADGLLALAEVKSKTFDLLLTDIRMPGLDGLALTQRVRQFEAEQGKGNMFIVGLSAYALEEVKLEALACGMDEFVSKPVDMEALMLKLEKYCGADKQRIPINI